MRTVAPVPRGRWVMEKSCSSRCPRVAYHSRSPLPSKAAATPGRGAATPAKASTPGPRPTPTTARVQRMGSPARPTIRNAPCGPKENRTSARGAPKNADEPTGERVRGPAPVDAEAGIVNETARHVTANRANAARRAGRPETWRTAPAHDDGAPVENLDRRPGEVGRSVTWTPLSSPAASLLR